MTGKIVGLSQALPFPGKLSAAEKVSEKNVEITESEIKDAENEVRKNVEQSYYELRFIRKQIQIENKNKELLKSILEVVKTKYSVSAASQQNILKVDLEITNINDKIEDLKGKEASQLAILKSILFYDSNQQIKTDSIFNVVYIKYNSIQLDSVAKINRPFLEGLELAKQKSVLQKDLAEYDFYPNFNLTFQYSQRDRIAKTNTPLDDFLTVLVGVSLPLNYGGKTSAKVEEMESLKQVYQEQYSQAQQILQSKFGSAVAQLNSLRNRIKLNEEGLTTQSNQNLKSALSSYQVGQIDFINVIDAQNQLYRFETNLYKLKTDYMKKIAELEFLTGTSLSK